MVSCKKVKFLSFSDITFLRRRVLALPRPGGFCLSRVLALARLSRGGGYDLRPEAPRRRGEGMRAGWGGASREDRGERVCRRIVERVLENSI